jgi:translation elongation factor EF-G
MTQGRAVSSMEFNHYAPLPENLAQDFVAKAQRT